MPVSGSRTAPGQDTGVHAVSAIAASARSTAGLRAITNEKWACARRHAGPPCGCRRPNLRAPGSGRWRGSIPWRGPRCESSSAQRHSACLTANHHQVHHRPPTARAALTSTRFDSDDCSMPVRLSTTVRVLPPGLVRRRHPRLQQLRLTRSAGDTVLLEVCVECVDEAA